MGKTYYMHTINGAPGVFEDGLICTANSSGPVNRLEMSLKDIKKNERATKKNRAKTSFATHWNYGHLRFEVPDE